jgi:Kdo2-lipid A phosphotransferase
MLFKISKIGIGKHVSTQRKTRKWNLKALLAGHLLVALVLYTLFPNPNTSIWSSMDRGVFHFLNSCIKDNFFMQNFWAMANHRLADWVEDILFLFFFVWILVKTPKEERVRKGAESLFVILFAATVIILSKNFIFGSLFHINRKSPTLIVDTFTYLPEKITWLKVKAKSYKSFPGDHATTALLSIVGFFYVARKNRKIQVLTTLYGIFLILPRMIVGAHWISDTLLGSGSTVLLFSLWAFCTPFASLSIRGIEKVFLSFKKKDIKAHG